MVTVSDHHPSPGGPQVIQAAKRLRLRLFSIAGALATTARVKTLHLSDHAPWTELALQALERLQTLAALPAPSG